MAVIGTLIAESLKVGAVMDDVLLTVTKVVRADVGDVSAGQSRTWTLVEFEIAIEDAVRFARVLERSLQPTGGWYCDFRSAEETFVVFAGRTFRYPRGDESGRADAVEYGRSVGVPETQLDWPA
jgi:hypothetical protein